MSPTRTQAACLSAAVADLDAAAWGQSSAVDQALKALQEIDDPRAAVEAAIKLVWEGENGRAA